MYFTLNVHYYPNLQYKSYITSLKAVNTSKNLISAGLDIDRILHFVFYDKILRHILSKYRQISKNKGAGGVTPPSHTHTHAHTPARQAFFSTTMEGGTLRLGGDVLLFFWVDNVICNNDNYQSAP